MYILYADESGNTGTDFDNSQQPIFVLGSVLVNENNWHNINRLLDYKKAEIDQRNVHILVKMIGIRI